MKPGRISLANPDFSGNELKYLTEAVQSGWLTHRGKYVELFEKAFSDYVGMPSIATSSGTGALHIALMALGIGPKDEVIIPDLTFAAPASAVRAVGAFPRLVDVNENGCMSKKAVNAAINYRTKAIIPVHLYGEDAGDFSEFGIPVIEDCCEALGYVKPRGDFAVFSFYGNKVITTGEGGMLCGDIEKAIPFRDGGHNKDYFHDVAGLNYRMTNLQAAVGLGQMERLEEFLEKRAKELEIYQSRLEGFGKWLFCVNQKIQLPEVETRPIFWPLHQMPPFKQYGNFPMSEKIWKTHTCLPIEQAEKVCDLIDEHNNLLRTSVSGIELAAQG